MFLIYFECFECGGVKCIIFDLKVCVIMKDILWDCIKGKWNLFISFIGVIIFFWFGVKNMDF